MRHTARMTMLLAAGLLQGACSPQEATGDAASATNANIVNDARAASDGQRETNAARGPAMANQRIVISSDWGRLSAELVDNSATRALVRMLPLTLEMRDHLRQEKTGTLPSPLPEVQRQTAFSSGTLGLWGATTSSSTIVTAAFPRPASLSSAG